jgi:hypothetical protein
MKKMIALTTGTALTLALGTVAAKPLAVVGLGALVLTVWTATFDDTLASETLFNE